MRGERDARFADAVIDTICPGLAGGDRSLPPATGAGLSGGAYRAVHEGVLRLIAAEAGGDGAFIAASGAGRVAILQAVERSAGAPFRALVQAVLADYHEAPAVLTAFGWRVDPPQPRGHVLEPMDGAMTEQLERVRRRGPLWRKAD